MANFSGTRFGNKALGFDRPTQLPADAGEHRAWQEANRNWWEASPMRYDWRTPIAAAPGTREYFEEVDRRFLSSARKYMPWREIPFDAVIPYATLGGSDVLEIGVGQGTHAQLMAPHCRSFTGIDLTATAVDMTTRRLQLFGLPGDIRRLDAEEMPFPDASFDYIWSWGVIHHSADTRRVLEQMNRVLRPGGRCTVMVYRRCWWHFYVCAHLRRLFQKDYRSEDSLHRVRQSMTDGALARHYSGRDWRATVEGLFRIRAVREYGLKAELLPLPHGRLKLALERAIPDAVARLVMRQFRMGSFLVAQMDKI